MCTVVERCVDNHCQILARSAGMPDLIIAQTHSPIKLFYSDYRRVIIYHISAKRYGMVNDDGTAGLPKRTYVFTSSTFTYYCRPTNFGLLQILKYFYGPFSKSSQYFQFKLPVIFAESLVVRWTGARTPEEFTIIYGLLNCL
jgi:hypothetical protein